MSTPSSPGALTSKPRSMFAGSRNILRSNDSASLWNCTLSPGWNEEESETLRLAVMKYGIGNWAKIIDSGYLPGKTNAQMNLQLQRLLGQQSTAEFAGLHIDPKIIGEQNSRIQGPDVRRKNNTIVNTGDKLSREELRDRILKNKEMYELPEEMWQTIQLDYMPDEDALLEEKKKYIKKMTSQLRSVQKQLRNLEFLYPDRTTKLKEELEQITACSSSPSTSEESTPQPSVPRSPTSEVGQVTSDGTDETAEIDEDMDDMTDQLIDDSDSETPQASNKDTSINDDTENSMSEADEILATETETRKKKVQKV